MRHTYWLIPLPLVLLPAIAQAQSLSFDLGAGQAGATGRLVQITAQRLYRLRCGCGRSWFELHLPHLVTCPACEKMGLVSP